jgi:uncharacterized membrane protein
MEQLVYMVLLSIHNVAVIGCVAGPFYMARIVKARAKYEKKIIYDMDRLEEDVITTQPAICWASLMALVITGFGFPATYYLFHGTFKDVSVLALVTLAVKLVLVAGMAVILYVGSFYFNPKLKELFAQFRGDQPPAPELEKRFFSLRARRKYWCDRCWQLGVLVLIASAVIRWS